MKESEYVNRALRDHQLDIATCWTGYPIIKRLHHFFDVFNDEFFGSERLPPAAFSLEKTRRTRLGHYVPGRNGLGICHNINLNSRWAYELSVLEQLIVLGHEMVHQWQELYGICSKAGWYHNKQFCQVAARIGVVAMPGRGNTIRITDPFLAVCRVHGVSDPIPEFSTDRPNMGAGEGRSTLKKWVCGCDPPVNVRVGIENFDATCNRCQNRFEAAGGRRPI